MPSANVSAIGIDESGWVKCDRRLEYFGSMRVDEDTGSGEDV